MSRFLFNCAVLLSFAFALSACAARDQTRVTDAATSPLNDLNLIQTEIPAVLTKAQNQPYAIPTDISCNSLATEIQDLDSALGPDIDTPATESNPGLIERGTNAAKNSVFSTLQSTTESIVPFRGWVRKLSGAEKYSKKVAASISAGILRRAFLKGFKVSKECS